MASLVLHLNPISKSPNRSNPTFVHPLNPSFIRCSSSPPSPSSSSSASSGGHPQHDKSSFKPSPSSSPFYSTSLSSLASYYSNPRRKVLLKEESRSKFQGLPYKDLGDGLDRLQVSDEEKAKNSAFQKLITPTFLLQPQKERLFKKYAHPNNMPSALKMKRAQKFTDEFKISESDCGSAPVQVAQLTRRIKHLASVLHKKDNHSRRGLVAMLQRRKKLLKYLRRTNRESYCRVISKLGLPDSL